MDACNDNYYTRTLQANFVLLALTLAFRPCYYHVNFMIIIWEMLLKNNKMRE